MSAKSGTKTPKAVLTPSASWRALLLAGSVSLLAVPALAQDAQDDPAERPVLSGGGGEDVEVEVDELVVTAQRAPPGAVVGDIPPEVQLSPAQIRSYGVSSVAELLTALTPQTASGRGRDGGRPIVLLNGVRISSFNEVRDLPTEAILRVDILPEEVALKYGYPADARVVNLVLRPRFRAVAVEGAVRAPTAGGRETVDANLSILRIQRDLRMQLDVKASKSSPLLESERDIRTDVALAPFDGAGPVTDERAFRTLSPTSDTLSVNAVLARSFENGLSATLNGRMELGETEARLGLPTATVAIPADSPYSPAGEPTTIRRYATLDPVRRTTDTSDLHLGLGVNGALSGWRWTFTSNADRVTSQTLTDRRLDASALQAGVDAGTVDPFAPPGLLLSYRSPDQSESVTTSADAQAVFNGNLFRMPAGDVGATFTAGAETRKFESESRLRGAFQSTELSRDLGRLQANVDLPLTSRRNEVLPVLGDLSLNANAAVEDLSDFGALVRVGGGLNWSPVKPLRIIASFTREEGAPSMQQLGEAVTSTPNVRVFDFLTGQTVEVTQLSGGNPLLASDTRTVGKLGVTVKPFSEQDLTFRADYTRTRIEDVIASFPTPTPEIEAAFPDRFVRDVEGRLLVVDARPVNFARQDREEVRWGFNYSKPLRSTRAPPFGPQGAAGGAAGGPGTAGPSGDGPRGGFGGPGGSGGFGRRGAGGGALQLAVFHTLRLQEEIFIRPGVPVLDLLEGSAVGSRGGQPRHEVEVQAGASRNGLGARLTARWQSATEVDGVNGREDLLFSDLATVDVRLFADLGLQPFARNRPWLRGARATLSVDNLFDERLDVRTRSGVTPISYQPDLIDPVGRTVRISFRKLFATRPAVRPPGQGEPPRP